MWYVYRYSSTLLYCLKHRSNDARLEYLGHMPTRMVDKLYPDEAKIWEHSTP